MMAAHNNGHCVVLQGSEVMVMCGVYVYLCVRVRVCVRLQPT